MANGKPAKEPLSISIEIDLLALLREYCIRHDRNQSDAVTLAIKTLLAIDKAKDPAFWMEQYAKAEE